MRRVFKIAEQFTLDGSIDYVVYYDDGAVYLFRDYPTPEQLDDPARTATRTG